MGNSETDLGRIEEQSLMVVSHDQLRGTYQPMYLISTNENPLNSQGGMSQSRGDRATPPTGDTEFVQEFPTSHRLSDLFALPGEDVQMTQEILTGISNGNKKCLEKLRSNGTSMAHLKSNRGDSVLHLAAMWGHLELVKEIVSECPCLLLEPNSEGRIPLHVAAHGGHTAVIETLIATFASARQRYEESERVLNPYVLKDEDGNTALHLAIEGCYLETAACLVNADQASSFLGNNKEKSSLYMAVEAGDVSLVKAILKNTCNEDLEGKKSYLYSKLQGRKYLAHAALHARNIDILDVILDEYPTLMYEQDSEGRTCLSLGASIGYDKGVYKLLERSTEIVNICDADGSFPIHKATEKGESGIVIGIVKFCPDSKHLLNRLGQNIFHVAAKYGRDFSIASFIENKDMDDLLVGQDVDGNTPLHLAVMNWHYESIPCLATNSNVLNIQNKRGLRARDIAELNLKPEYIFKERWTLALLLQITYTKRLDGFKSIESLTRPSDPPKNNRDYVNTLLLVAALVATVTFAAGFTIPGGFISDPKLPHLGRAVLAKNPTLCIFLVLDIFTMQSSVAAICTLIWAQLGDPELIRSSLKLALPLLLFALLCMPLAFLFGVIIAVGHVKWLLVIICIISALFFCWAMFILAPHVMLQGSYVPPKFAGDFLVTFMHTKELIEVIVQLIRFLSSGYKPKSLQPIQKHGSYE